MNDHVVDGKLLTDFVQEQYLLAISNVKKDLIESHIAYNIYKDNKEDKQRIQDKFQKICREFKIAIIYDYPC